MAPARSQNGASEVLERRISSTRVIVKEAFSYKVTSVGVTIFMPGTVVNLINQMRMVLHSNSAGSAQQQLG
jgi:hypothetical protein